MAQFNSDSEFHAVPGTDDGGVCFRNPDSKGAFFGGTPIPRPTITAANSAPGTAGGVLVALGLAEQIP